MTKSRAARARIPRLRKPGSVLERLEADEAHAVLRRLLTAHPAFEPRRNRRRACFSARFRSSPWSDDVEHALRSLDLDDLGNRTGRHRGG